MVLILPLMIAGLSCQRAKKEEPQGAMTLPPGESELAIKQEEAPSISVANVVLYPAGREAVTFTVEIANTPEARRQGLQGRENLGANHGMWFVFEGDVQDPFWMKNTAIALDILFVGNDNKIVDFVENAVPNSETLLVPRAQYRYTLEINAGAVREHGLRVGDSVEFRLGPP